MLPNTWMIKYRKLQDDLAAKGTGRMKVFGQSMLPIIKSGAILTYQAKPSYEVGDIVFCKVRGRFIDAHKVLKKDGDRYQIGNNHGHINGWSRQLYGKVVKIEYHGHT
jgi:SOS-response transcriptional repressor LexA